MALGAAALIAAPAWAGGLQVQVQDEAGRPLSEAVVFLESPEAARLVKPLVGVEMAQSDRAFVPQVLAITRGTAVAFPNRDTVRHHVYSFSPAKRFELKLYAGTPANPVVFDRPGVAVLGCNIHDQMIAWVVVVDTPFVATTGPQARVGWAELPDGAYRLRVWHPRLPVGEAAWSQPVQVGTTAAVTVRLTGLMP